MSSPSDRDDIGIDWIPFALGYSKIENKGPFSKMEFAEIRKKVHRLSATKVEDALSFSEQSLEEETARCNTIEGKASNLITATGISAVFVTGLYSLLPKGLQGTSTVMLLLLLAGYSLIVLSLTITVLLASRVVEVTVHTSVDIEDIFKMNSETLLETKKERLASYLYSYEMNSRGNNIKTSYLIGAQMWYRNSVVLFLALAFILMLNLLNPFMGL